MRKINKKGAEMTVGTIIIIVLALIVLVLLVLGFTTGWSSLWDKMKSFLGGGTNVQSVMDACNVACASQSKYDFCDLKRSINFGKQDDGSEKKLDMTCNELKNEVSSLVCDSITCSGATTGKKCADIKSTNVPVKSGEWLAADASTKTCPDNYIDKTNEVTDSDDKTLNPDNKCCVMKTCPQYSGAWTSACNSNQEDVTTKVADGILSSNSNKKCCKTKSSSSTIIPKASS